MDFESLSDSELENVFKSAYDAVSTTSYKFKQDTLLYFYAYYKNISKDYDIEVNHLTHNGEQLVNAFKMNALFQVRHLSERESKIKYIELAIKHIGEDFIKD